ncbi:MAG: AIR synthase-related protein [Candidatus Heimdallarchaeota archaeon]
MGKFLAEDLQEIIACIAHDPEVLIPPRPGFDAGVFNLDNERCVVIATDPCVGVPEAWFGWFLIHFACSDVALFGIPPRLCSVNILAPLNTSKDIFKRIMTQVCNTTKDLDISLVTGHSGTYSGIFEITGTCTALGIGLKRNLITPAGAQPGDKIFITKNLGLEVLINYSFFKESEANELFGHSKVQAFQNMIEMQSCVKDALTITQSRAVSAMKDITEGGFIIALNELADASKLGFRVSLEKLPISEEFHALVKAYHLSLNQILGTSSTGVITGALTPSKEKQFMEHLKKRGIEATIVGEFRDEQQKVLVTADGAENPFPYGNFDPYTLLLES